MYQPLLLKFLTDLSLCNTTAALAMDLPSQVPFRVGPAYLAAAEYMHLHVDHELKSKPELVLLELCALHNTLLTATELVQLITKWCSHAVTDLL